MGDLFLEAAENNFLYGLCRLRIPINYLYSSPNKIKKIISMFSKSAEVLKVKIRDLHTATYERQSFTTK